MSGRSVSECVLYGFLLVALVALLLGCGGQTTFSPPLSSPTPWLAPTFTPSPSPRPLISPSPHLLVSPSPPSPPTSSPTPQQPTDNEQPATATAQPTSTPAPLPVAVWEGTITLNTYDWEQALVPSSPDDPIFPYPHLDFDTVGPPTPRAYQAVFLQNRYVQLIVLPDLGGRILRWTDRTTGRQLLYTNPVVKPTRWGYRGWWFATGGIEWAFPTEEHGLNEYRSWSYQLLWNGVRVWDTDDRTGLQVEVTVRLEAGSSRVVVSPHISNPTDRAQPFQFWANGMLTLSDTNAPSPDLTFVLPASEVIVHSTGDGSLPGPDGRMAWPVYGGRDFSRYPEWRSWLGIFAPQAADSGFSGAYDLGIDQGVVRVAPSWVRGVKLFCLGDLGSELWTDDGSRYFELWGGLTPTFWDYATLGPGEETGWTEYWYAVSGVGGYTWANDEGAVRLTPMGNGVEVAVETVRPLWATVILYQKEQEAARWQAEIGPDLPFRTTWGPGNGPWGVEVLDAEGSLLIGTGP